MSVTTYAVVCFIAIGGSSGTSLEELATLLPFTDDLLQDAFDGLNVVKKEEAQITKDDLDQLLYFAETDFAKDKFIQLIDSKDGDKAVNREELDIFLKKTPVTLTVHACCYIKSETLREWCFADQILTYITLVLDKETVSEFYKEFQGDVDLNKYIEHFLWKNRNLLPGFDKDNMKVLINEIGGDDQQISEDEFTNYVMQGDLQDDFRACRRNGEGNAFKYDMDCLVRELLHYTKQDLTEQDISAVFEQIDANKNKQIEAIEIGVTMSEIIILLDVDGDGMVSFGEFRTYAKKHSVKVQLEKACTKPFQYQEDEVFCIHKKIAHLVKEKFAPIWMTVFDLDLLFIFEDLDTNNNGVIRPKEDLVAKQWTSEEALKFISVLDNKRHDKIVNLEGDPTMVAPVNANKQMVFSEFCDYMREPHMVYGVGDCMIEPKGETRIKCYEEELKRVIMEMLDDEEVDSLFEYYSKRSYKMITQTDLKEAGIKEPEALNLLKEIGMGNSIITKYEFTWFVRQQALSSMYKEKTPEELHKTLVVYLTQKMTEYDTQTLFSKMDTDNNRELTDKDCQAEVLAKIDTKKGTVKTVNFVEFWVYLNTPRGDPKKKKLESLCPKNTEKKGEEISCYVAEIANL